MELKKNKRIIYFTIFIFLLLTEALIAIFVHDNFIRSYFGDIIAVILVYCFVRIFLPEKLFLLPLYVFAFAAGLEILQAINILEYLNLQDNKFISTVMGTTFAWLDILCYLIGCIILFGIEIAKVYIKRKNKASLSIK